MDSARVESGLIKRWRRIDEEQEDDKSSTKTLKEAWFRDAYKFLINLPADSHCWCRHKDVSLPLLEPFYLYFKDPDEDSAIRRLWRKMSSQFRQCISCVIEYYKAKNVYWEDYMGDVVKPIMAVLDTLDRARVASHMEELTSSKSDDRSQEVICVLFEVLMYPALLEHKGVNDAFVPFFKYVSSTHDLHLAQNQRYPGLYALLFHANKDVRRVAAELANCLGPFEDDEELEVVQPVIEKRMKYLESVSGGESGNIEVGITYDSLWLGLKTLLGLLKAPAFEDGIIERYPPFVSIVLNHVSENSSVFWNALLCLKLLLEVLGYKLWLKSSFSPGVLRNTLLSQCFHGRQERIHKAIFDLFQVFLQSLEAVQDGQYERQRRYLLYFFLLQVPHSSNFSSLMTKTASQVAFSIVSRGYKMQPPLVAFECAHFWGPPLVSTFNDERLHPSVRQPAIDLLQLIIVADAAALAGIYLKGQESDSLSMQEAVSEDAATFSWQSFSEQTSAHGDRWFCLPLLWLELLDRSKGFAMLPSLAKAFIWSVSRLAVFDLKSYAPEGDVLMVEGSHVYSAKVGLALQWEQPKGFDDGGDGKGCANAVKADAHLLELVWIFKRCAESFASERYDDIVKSCSWDATMAEPMLLLLVDSSSIFQKLGKHMRHMLTEDNSLEAGIQAILQNQQSVISLRKGFVFATKMLLVQPFNRVPLQNFLFISAKVLYVARAVLRAFCQDLSRILWPLLVKLISEGKERAKEYELCSIRMLELVPLVFKCLIPPEDNDAENFGLFWEVRLGEDCPSWFESLLKWRELSSPTIQRHWNEATVSILEDLARGPLAFTARRCKAVTEILRPGFGLTMDQRERMEVLFSSADVIEVSDNDKSAPPVKAQVPVTGKEQTQHTRPRKRFGKTTQERRILADDAAAQERVENVRKERGSAEASQPGVTRKGGSAQVENVTRNQGSAESNQAGDFGDQAQTTNRDAENDLLLKEVVDEGDIGAALDAARRQRAAIAPTTLQPKRKLVRIEMPGEQLKGSLPTRPKPRSQRPPPVKPDEWLHRILSLDVFALEEADNGELLKVPTSFEDADHYMQVFRPLVLEEFKAQLQRGYQEVDPKDKMTVGTVNLMSLDRVDALHTARFISGRGSGSAASACMEHDLVLLSKQPFEKANEDAHILGKVERRELRKTDGIILIIKLSLMAPNNERLRRAKAALVERSSWHVTRIINITPQLREFQAISSLATSPLAAVVLHPAPSRPTASRVSLESRGLSKEFCVKLRAAYNPSQLAAIETCLGGRPGSHHQVSLVQGPPGTGKTRTIVAIISALLQSNSAEPVAAKHSLQKVNYQAAIARSWQDAALARQLESEKEVNKSSRRLLVCAQSNAAVDELVRRICENGLYSASGAFYKPKIVRVGNANAVHQTSLPYFIDTLVENRLASDKAVEEGDSQADSTNLRAKLEEVTEALSELGIQCAELANDKQEEAQALHAKLNYLRSRRRELAAALQKSDSQARKNSEAAKVNRKKVRNDIIREAQVVLTTLSGSGGDIYSACMECVGPNKEVYFDAVVIDEAGQALEPATLIPLQLLSDAGATCIMIGDPKQLPATVMSQAATKMCFQRSMFERFQDSGFPVTMLSVQYRMHPEIRKFPSRYFYDNKLVDGDNVLGDRRRAPFHKDRIFGPCTFLDVVEGQETVGGSLQSVSNVEEANVAVELFRCFIASYRKEVQPGRLGIITPYKRQQILLRDKFSKAFPDLVRNIEFNTIDGFQGREVDVLVLSTVRSESRIGFVADVRRMNVALTRARFSCWVLGNAKALRNDPAWAALLDDAAERQLILQVQRPYSKTFGVFSALHASFGYACSLFRSLTAAVLVRHNSGVGDVNNGQETVSMNQPATAPLTAAATKVQRPQAEARPPKSVLRQPEATKVQRPQAEARFKRSVQPLSIALPDSRSKRPRLDTKRAEEQQQAGTSTLTSARPVQNSPQAPQAPTASTTPAQAAKTPTAPAARLARDLAAERRSNRAEAESLLGASLRVSRPVKRPAAEALQKKRA